MAAHPFDPTMRVLADSSVADRRLTVPIISEFLVRDQRRDGDRRSRRTVGNGVELRED